MTARTFSRQDGEYRVDVRVNERVRALVKVMVGQDTLHADMVEVCSEAARAAWVEKMIPTLHRGTVDLLLRSLVAEIADWRMGPDAQPAGADEGNDGFPVIDVWPEPVDLARLLDQIVSVLDAHVLLPPGAARLLAPWVVHTYCIDAATHSPILWVRSPEKSCGKTVLVDLLAAMARRTFTATNASPASVFRMIELYQPKVMLDDTDSWLKAESKSEITSILNGGFKRGAKVWRTVPDEEGRYMPKTFAVFCPKVVSGIGHGVLDDTTASRTILVDMQKHPKSVTAAYPRLRDEDNERLGRPIRAQAARWAADHLEELRAIRPTMPRGIGGRDADRADAILAIASLAGPSWRESVERACFDQFRETETDHADIGVQLGAELKILYDEQAPKPHSWLGSSAIVEWLNGRDGAPWVDWRGGRGLSAKGLAKQLVERNIRPVPGGPRRDRQGYTRDQFAKFWATLAETGGEEAPSSPRQSSASSDSLPYNDLGQRQSSASADDLKAGKSLWDNNADDAEDENEGYSPGTISETWGESRVEAQASPIATAKLDRLLSAEAARAVKR